MAKKSMIEELEGDDLRGVQELEKTLPDNFSLSTAVRFATEKVAAYQATRKEMHRRRRNAIAAIYPEYIYVGGRPKRFQRVLVACDRKGIRFTATTPLAVALVRLRMELTDKEAVNRYANVLRGAAISRIPAQELASLLDKKRCGINATSRAYQESRREQAQAESGPDDKRRNSPATEGPDAATAESTPTLEWTENALKAWRSAEDDTKPRLVVAKIGADLGKVMCKIKRRTK